MQLLGSCPAGCVGSLCRSESYLAHVHDCSRIWQRPWSLQGKGPWETGPQILGSSPRRLTNPFYVSKHVLVLSLHREVSSSFSEGFRGLEANRGSGINRSFTKPRARKSVNRMNRRVGVDSVPGFEIQANASDVRRPQTLVSLQAGNVVLKPELLADCQKYVQR